MGHVHLALSDELHNGSGGSVVPGGGPCELHNMSHVPPNGSFLLAEGPDGSNVLHNMSVASPGGTFIAHGRSDVPCYWSKVPIDGSFVLAER